MNKYIVINDTNTSELAAALVEAEDAFEAIAKRRAQVAPHINILAVSRPLMKPSDSAFLYKVETVTEKRFTVGRKARSL